MVAQPRGGISGQKFSSGLKNPGNTFARFHRDRVGYLNFGSNAHLCERLSFEWGGGASVFSLYFSDFVEYCSLFNSRVSRESVEKSVEEYFIFSRGNYVWIDNKIDSEEFEQITWAD